jgi:uncharacterized protein YlaI
MALAGWHTVFVAAAMELSFRELRAAARLRVRPLRTYVCS